MCAFGWYALNWTRSFHSWTFIQTQFYLLPELNVEHFVFSISEIWICNKFLKSHWISQHLASHKYCGAFSQPVICGSAAALLTHFGSYPLVTVLQHSNFTLSITLRGALGVPIIRSWMKARVLPCTSNIWIFNPGRILLFQYKNAKCYGLRFSLNWYSSAPSFQC